MRNIIYYCWILRHFNQKAECKSISRGISTQLSFRYISARWSFSLSSNFPCRDPFFGGKKKYCGSAGPNPLTLLHQQDLFFLLRQIYWKPPPLGENRMQLQMQAVRRRPSFLYYLCGRQAEAFLFARLIFVLLPAVLDLRLVFFCACFFPRAACWAESKFAVSENWCK